MKDKKCKNCGEVFEPQRSMQQACSVPCAIELANKAKVKSITLKAAKERKALKEKLDAMRTKPQLVKLAQTAFNAFIRARDAGKPCISCGTQLSSDVVGGAFDCGHYRSVGSAAHMRFVEDNAHGQCKHCNRHLAGNHVEYRKGLVNRIGAKRVEQIESDSTLRKYTHEGLVEIARHYRAETRKILR